MKTIKAIYPILAISMAAALAGCDDQKMEWREPDKTVSSSELPLELAEKIANYDYIKAYAEKYHPGLNIACGIGAQFYLNDADYKAVVDDNFTGVTLGNAMKHQSMVSASGKVDFTTVDAMLAAMPAGMKLYGHNLLWHTQQQQSYLKSLIAPEMVVEPDGSGIANVLHGDASDFNGGTSGGWGSWGSNKEDAYVEQGAGEDGSPAMVLVSKADGNAWEAQFAYTFDDYLSQEETYVFKFKAKSSVAAGELQFQYQNGTTYGSQGGYNTFSVGTDWKTFEYEFTVNYDDVNRIILNFGSVGATYYIDDIEFGTKAETGPANLCDNGDFSNGMAGWNANNPGAGIEVVEIGDAPSGNAHVLKMTASSSSSNAWDLQALSPVIPIVTPGAQVELSFFVKSEGAGQGRVSFSSDLSNQWPWMNWTGNQASWTEAFETSDSWTRIDVVLQQFGTDFVEGSSTWQFNLDFGYVPDATYYIDNVVVSEVSAANAPRRAGGVTYKLKSAEEKKAILLAAMEEWIKTMMEHCGTRVDAWDVINEPINDGGGWRGIDGVFGGSVTDDNGNTVWDKAPTETETEGLNLNWAGGMGNAHFYWGYYIGKEYASKAFEYARKYAPAGTKLFVNDYGLESSPNKLRNLIEFVNYIESQGQTVDGIGTQMHVSVSITKEQVDAMFQTMAATGKLVRITELDITLGTSSPTAAQLKEQSDCYQMIIESYFANVPVDQQSAITIWSLSDSEKEHEYWLSGDCPNIFDGKYQRKHAYKGVCDALAGYDVSTDFDGNAWKK